MRNQQTQRIIASQLIDILAGLKHAQWVEAVVECDRHRRSFLLMYYTQEHYSSYHLFNLFAYLKECLEEYGEVVFKLYYALPQYKWAVFFDYYIIEEECNEEI